MTSSFGSMPPAYDAVLRKGEENVGPIRLPDENAEQFVEQFDDTYRRVGISISTMHVEPIADVGQVPSRIEG